MAIMAANPTNNWLGYFKPAPRASLRLFCFPYSGASASLYYPWASIMPAEIELCPVELPGRGARMAETPFTEIAPLIHSLMDGLHSLFDKPFAFFGHSMGALVSFELARALKKQSGLTPTHVFVSGHGAPHIKSDMQPIHDLPEPEFITKLRELSGTDESVLQNQELRQILLPILRADFSICDTYTYQAGAPLGCPISAFGGLEDTFVPRAELDGWKEHTQHTFKTRMFPGNHFYINAARSNLIRIIAQELLYPSDRASQRAYA